MEDAPSREALLQSLKGILPAALALETNDIDQFVRDVKEQAAKELYEELYSYWNDDQKPQHALLDILKNLKPAGPETAEIINFELQDGSTPFVHACNIFKEMVALEEDEASLKDFSNGILKELIHRGAEFHEDSRAYREVFDSGAPSLLKYRQALTDHVQSLTKIKNTLIESRETLMQHATLRKETLKEKIISIEFARLGAIDLFA